MNPNFIIDAHAHIGYPNVFPCPEVEPEELLLRMDSMKIEYALLCGDMESIINDAALGLGRMERIFEQSGGRLPYLCVYNPRQSESCIKMLDKALNSPGFKGVKIHPTFHKTPAGDKSYERVWNYAYQNSVPILSHTWSVSSYNSGQALSTPGKFEAWVKEFPSVKLILGHSGGRGTGRIEAIRMAQEYENVFMDFAGDVYCFDLIKDMVNMIPPNKFLFGSDWPWMDPRANLDRVFLSSISIDLKRKIFRDNASFVYKIGEDCV